ncbi:MAG: hypothetical protein KGP28_04485 [Bdellovibrionales bacterium]|nr:hypothetical protein [Bdellovibrionales bacterium]
MMSNKGLLLLISMIVLSACGGSQVNAVTGSSGNAPLNQLDRSELESSSVTDGSLAPLSDYDLRMDPVILEYGLPFLHDAEFENSFSTLRHPRNGTKKVRINQQVTHYAVHSNLVFRSIRQLPPKAAILGVRALKLRISGFLLYSKDNPKPDQGQSLCLLDGRVCVGESPETGSDVALAGNPKFWKGAEVYPADFLNSKKLKEVSQTDDGGKILSAESGDFEIDLLQAFKLSEKSAVEFIFKHSEAYSSPESGFRKFRFSIGDRIHANGGELILDLVKDQSTIPAGYEKRLPAPVHGASDTVIFEAKKKRRVLSNAKSIEEDLPLILLEEDLGTDVISKLSAKLLGFRDQIEQIRVISLGAGSPSIELAQKVKSELLKAGLIENALVILSKGEEGIEDSVGISVKFRPEIESDQKEREKILEELHNVKSGGNESNSELSKKNEDLSFSSERSL